MKADVRKAFRDALQREATALSSLDRVGNTAKETFPVGGVESYAASEDAVLMAFIKEPTKRRALFLWLFQPKTQTWVHFPVTYSAASVMCGVTQALLDVEKENLNGRK